MGQRSGSGGSPPCHGLGPRERISKKAGQVQPGGSSPGSSTSSIDQGKVGTRNHISLVAVDPVLGGLFSFLDPLSICLPLYFQLLVVLYRGNCGAEFRLFGRLIALLWVSISLLGSPAAWCCVDRERSLKPTVLLITTSRWIPTARLAMALANAGFTVDAVCPSAHPLHKIGAVRRTHAYRGLAPVASIGAGIAASDPGLLIPCDDLATRQLHEVHERSMRRGDAGSAICKLIERSLGSHGSFPIVYARTPFIEMAQAEGVRVPHTALLTNISELQAWIAQMGLPVVLKSNGSSGGEGVRIAQTASEAVTAFKRLQAPPRVAQGIKRAFVDRDKTLIWPSILRSRSIVNAQEFVVGREATSLIACWQGTVLASLHFEVVHKMCSSGPATVIRLIDNPEMTSATQKMALRLGLCGLHGFDFMLEANTGNAYLIEINPRTTQIGHLTLGLGRDLPAALYAAVSGAAIQPAPNLTEKHTIVLFPGEWTRNPESAFLRSAYHDVPWEEPELVRIGLEKHRQQSHWYSQKKLERSVSLAVPHH
jgi:hypothetical protein